MAMVAGKEKKNFKEILELSGLNGRMNVNKRKRQGQMIYFNL